jgi:cell division protein FtsN
MRRRSSVESPPQSFQPIHPVLQSALNSLDIELEEELARYRRLRGRRLGQAHQSISSQKLSAPASSLLAIAPETKETDTTDINPFKFDQSLTNQSLADQTKDTQPDDYLESSEELLKSLAEEEANLRAEQEPGLLETLLTPLGIGSMLLLLLSTVTFGYLLTNLSNVTLLELAKLFNPSNSTSEVTVDASQAEDTKAATAPTAPDLTSEEFVELNLGNLSRLPGDGATGPLAVPNPVVTPTPQIPSEPVIVSQQPTPTPAPPANSQRSPAQTSPVRTGQLRQSSSRTPRATASRPPNQSRQAVAPHPAQRSAAAAAVPTPASPSAPTPAVPASTLEPQTPPPAVAASAVNPTPALVREDLYYVVTDYDGDNSLEAARQSVDDAYVRNFPDGARVQLGAFSEESRAEEMRNHLEQQGISAEIYQP